MVVAVVSMKMKVISSQSALEGDPCSTRAFVATQSSSISQVFPKISAATRLENYAG